MTQTGNRLEYPDNLKAVLIFLVVAAHLGCTIKQHTGFAYSIYLWPGLFMMPLFIFIAGYFFKSADSPWKTLQRIAEFSGYYIFIKLMRHLERIAAGKPEAFDLFTEKGTPWFSLFMVWAAILMFLIVRAQERLCKTHDRKTVSRITLTILLVIAILAGYTGIPGDFLVLLRTTACMPFFYAGYIYRQSGGRLDTPKKYIPPAAAAAALFISFCLFYANIKTVRHLGNIIMMNACVSAFKLPGPAKHFAKPVYFAAASVLSFFFLSAVPKTFPLMQKLITRIGVHSLGIYIYHRIIIYALEDMHVAERCGKAGVPGCCLWLALVFPLVLILQMECFSAPLTMWRAWLKKHIAPQGQQPGISVPAKKK